MKKVSKLFVAFITSAFILGLIPLTAFAEGSFTVDKDSIQMNVGDTAEITVTAENAAGKIEWSSEGPATASGTATLENNSEVISVYASEAGTAYVTITATDMKTYDDEVIDSSYVVTVEIADSAVDTQESEAETEELAAEEEEVKEAAAEDITPGSEIYKGTEDFSGYDETQRLTVYMNDTEYRLIQYPLIKDEESGEIVVNPEIRGIDQLANFDLVNVNYKGVPVDSFVYGNGELRVFVLEDQTNYVCDYYTYDSSTDTFTVLPYLNVNQRMYIMINIPEDFTIPSGYKAVDLKLGESVIRGIQRVSDTQLNGYTTEVSPGLDSVDPTNDIYYIYCIVDGNKQLYSYDITEGTIQRAAIFAYTEVPTETVQEAQPEETETETSAEITTQSAAELDSVIFSWKGISINSKTLIICLGVAIVLLIILIIVCLVLSHGNRKKEKEIERRDAIAAKHSSVRHRGKKSTRPEPRKPRPEFNKDDDYFSYAKTEQTSVSKTGSYEPLMKKSEKKSSKNNDDIDIDFL